MTTQPKTLAIRFFAPVQGDTIIALSNAVDQALRDRVRRLVLLISTGGGTVFHGLSAYNYLKGLPIEVITHNFGSVDSIGVVLFCAGSRRLSVPHARFLLHGVSSSFQQNERLEEKQLEERLKGLQIDILNIARVIATTTGKSPGDVVNAMGQRTTLDPDQARQWGLVHELKSDLFVDGTPVIAIQAP